MAKRKKMTTKPKPEKDKEAKRIAYSQALVVRMCEMIGGGLTLKEVCALPDMPGRTTAYKWLAQHDEFANLYARAREERADMVADEVIMIADTEPDPAKARVRIDARKWWAAKVNPKKYADKGEVNVVADHQHHHTVEPLSESAHWLARMLGTGADSEAPKSLSNGSLLPA
jgi:hypothetical protein